MKKNIIKIPPRVMVRLHKFASSSLVAACTMQYKLQDVNSGALEQFGIVLSTGGAEVGLSGRFEPPPTSGRYSRINSNGTTKIHTDQPKVPREIEGTIKDWHGNYHTVMITRQCYPRSELPAKHVQIEAKIIRKELDWVVVGFRVNDELNCSQPDFNERLLFDLNLLQENIGYGTIELASIDISQYQHILSVDWPIFPPGALTSIELACRLFGRSARNLDDKAVKIVDERYDFLMKLGARQIIVGTDSFYGYIGAELSNDVVVFENIRFGNAIYILNEDWRQLSKMTKGELQALKKGAIRILHIEGWKHEVMRTLAMLKKDNRM